jgi:hypothetical protein
VPLAAIVSLLAGFFGKGSAGHATSRQMPLSGADAKSSFGLRNRKERAGP